MADEKLMKIHFMGEIIGTASGWDQSDDFAIQAYDFKPIEPVRYNLTPCDCLVLSPFADPDSQYFQGVICSLNDEGEVETVFQLKNETQKGTK